MKNIERLTDNELALAARKIDAEAKLRANRREAASAISAILKKYGLSASDLSQLDLGQKSKKAKLTKTSSGKGRRGKITTTTSKKADKRAKVAFKYKNPKGLEKWSGRGRPPKWVSAILTQKRISLVQFKANKRYKI